MSWSRGNSSARRWMAVLSALFLLTVPMAATADQSETAVAAACRKAAAWPTPQNGGPVFEKIDAPTAIAACAAAISQDPDNDDLYAYHARALVKGNRTEEAFRLLSARFPTTSAVAHAYLGVMYDQGYGVASDLEQAAEHYCYAAERGHASAQFNLGRMFETGRGVVPDLAGAVRLYRLAAEQGNAAAQVNLGTMYQNGLGVVKDLIAAARLYRLAAEQGEATGQVNLGLMYKYGRGTQQNDAEAVRLFRLAAEQQDANGQVNLGLMYHEGRGLARNDAEAVRLLRLAAGQGSAAATSHLARLNRMPAADPQVVHLALHPTLEAPDEMYAGEEVTVTIALTKDELSRGVTVKPGPNTSVTADGALSLSLPDGEDQWPIDIDLLATGFDSSDGSSWSRRVTLFRQGGSDFARFLIRPRHVRGPSEVRQLIARIYHQGEFLGSVSRPITVFGVAKALKSTWPDSIGASENAAPKAAASLAEIERFDADQSFGADLEIAGGEEVADLDVTIHYFDPEGLGDGLIFIHSPHIPPISAEFTTPSGISDWLNGEYRRLFNLALKARSAHPLTLKPTKQDPEAQRRFVLKVAEGFGADLYRNYVPDPFKESFWLLKRAGKLHSIQITSNNPVLPWELVLPLDTEGKADGFLGINYRLARWAPRSSAGQVDRPLDHIAFNSIATIAPPYDQGRELPFQQVEVEALSKLEGFRLVGGDFRSVEDLVRGTSKGFIHFSGHGEVNVPGNGAPVFAIQLLDQALDPITWRALTFPARDKGNPFFFFNACDTGQARPLGGFRTGMGACDPGERGIGVHRRHVAPD